MKKVLRLIEIYKESNRWLSEELCDKMNQLIKIKDELAEGRILRNAYVILQKSVISSRTEPVSSAQRVRKGGERNG